MAEFPALPLFTDAILADTGHLNDEEFGRYVRILIIMWRSPGCKIPNDKNWIAKRLRVDSLRFDATAMPLLVEFCQNDGNWWTQKRLQKEYLYVKKLSEKQSENAKSRWQKEKTPSRRKSLASKRHSSGIASGNAPTPTPIPLKTPSLPPSSEKTVISAGRLQELLGKDSGEKKFDVEKHLNDNDRAEARKVAPGWDLNGWLIPQYNERVNGGGYDVPKYPARAFIAWCKSFTKGKTP